jgi:8-oxo-dGTP diphosphatase
MGVFDRPQVGVGAIVLNGERILLVLRGNQPNAHQWAIPGGRQRLGESLQEAAEREIREETGVVIRAGEVIYTTEFIERDAAGVVGYHYVILDLAAEYLSGELCAGDDALEVRWVPFSELAQLPVNASTTRALQHLYPEQFA